MKFEIIKTNELDLNYEKSEPYIAEMELKLTTEPSDNIVIKENL